MPEMIKKLLLLVPWVNAYVARVRQLHQDLIVREVECAQLRDLIAQSRLPGLFRRAEDFATECLMAHPMRNSVTVLTITSHGPEMSSNLVLRYHEETRRMTRRYFLSMNHESFPPATVHHYVNHGHGLERLYRFKSWTREGYVEEYFRIK